MKKFILIYFLVTCLIPFFSAGQSYQVTVFNMANTPVFTTNSFKAATMGKYDEVWVGSTNQGLYRFNGTAWRRATILTNYNIRALYMSPVDSAIWVAQSGTNSTNTGGGVTRIADTNYSLTYYGSIAGAPTRYAYGIVADGDNIAWSAHGPHITASVVTGGGIGKFVTGSTTGSTITSGLPSGNFATDRRCISIAKKNGEMWVGVDRSCADGTCNKSYISRYNTVGGITVLDSITASNSPIPFSSQPGGASPRAIGFDEEGRAWVGLSSGGIAVLSNGTWTILNETNSPFPAGAAVNYQAITHDYFGRTYIGTTGGILIYNGLEPINDSANYTLINQSKGLPSNNVTGIAVGAINTNDFRYTLWLTTTAGIARLVPDSDLDFIHRKFKYNGSAPPVIYRQPISYLACGAIKIACDGSQSSLFKFSRLSLTNCIFRIKEDPDALEEEIYGLLIMQPSSGDSCVAIYQHPNYLAASLITNQLTGRIHLEVYNTVEDQVIEILPMELFRPPVLMIHGLWSSGNEAFYKMKKYLITQNMYKAHEITLVNYPNDVPFSSNLNQIINEFKVIINNCYERGISCGKADVVAHSMGGILSRLYLQHPRYNHDINKLITLNTPHSGSQMANFLLSTDLQSKAIRNVLSSIGKNSENGAVADLRVNSSAIVNDLNGGANLNLNVVPSHAICTKETISLVSVTMLGQALQQKWGFIIAGIIARAYSSYYLTNNIFNGSDNDFIVALNSQEGGLTGIKKTLFDDQWHSSTENSLVQWRVKELLKQSNTYDILFAMDGYDPPQLSYTPTAPPPVSKTSLSNPVVTITSPQHGSIVNPLDTVSISVTGSNGVTSLMVTAGNPLLPAQTAYYDTTAQTFTYEVPAEAVGKIGIAVMGFALDGNIALDSTYIIVQPNAVLDSITVEPDTIRLSVFVQTLPVVNGHYNDSVVRDLSVHPQVFRRLSTGNAALLNDNTLFGMHEGIDTLTVDFQGKTRKVVIYISSPDSGSAVVPGKLTLSGVRGTGSPAICYNASQVLTVAGNNTTYLVTPGGSVSLIAGQKISLLPGLKVSQGGYLSAKITASGQYCSITNAFLPDNLAGPGGNDPSSDGMVVTDADMMQTRSGIFSLYPNPTEGLIRISRLNPPESHETRLEIYTLQGDLVQRETWKDDPVYSCPVQNLPAGLYLIRLISGDATGVFRVVKL